MTGQNIAEELGVNGQHLVSSVRTGTQSTGGWGFDYSIRKAVITPSRIGTMLPTYRVSSATSRLCSRM